MLAGRVKLKTFAGVSAAVVGLSFAGLFAWWSSRPPEPDPPPRPAMGTRTPAAPPPRVADPTEVLPSHAYLLAQAGTALDGARVQDASGSTTWKINLYQDPGFSTINRAKIDLDRDDRWDEKWTYHPDGRITRQVSPGDDEVYSLRFEWSGERWVPEGAAAEPPSPVPAAVVPPATPSDYPIVDAHRWLLAQVGRDLGASRVQEAVRGRSYKINLYQDEGFAVMNRAKIDHDRDDRWDEKWTFHPDGRITLQVSPNDDEQHTDRYAWSEDRWVRE